MNRKKHWMLVQVEFEDKLSPIQAEMATENLLTKVNTNVTCDYGVREGRGQYRQAYTRGRLTGKVKRFSTGDK